MDSEMNKPLTEATKRDIQDHIQECKENDLGNKTISIRFTAIRQFFQWLSNEGRIDEPPTRNLESGVDTSLSRKQQERRSGKPVAVTNAEKEQLCEHVPDPKVRNELLIRLLFQTGIRSKELRNIRIQDVDRDERSIRIEDAKSEKYRKVYYRDLEPWLSQWLDHGYRDSMRSAADSNYLFLTNRAGKFNKDRPNKIVTKAADNADIQSVMYTDGQGGERKRITTHALRHGFARHCVKEGMDISYLKDLMGHENLETTKVYLKFTNQDRRDAVRVYGPSPE
jgi:integrase/recombinase XerD